MHQSKANVYIHFVWATKWRETTIPPELERRVYRLISAEVQRCRCQVIALNGMPDHIHLLVQLGREITLAALMNQVKGVSARFINTNTESIAGDAEKEFHWQPTYGSFSVGPNQVERVVAYIRNQKQHHADNELHASWEAAPTESRAAKPSDPVPTIIPEPQS